MSQEKQENPAPQADSPSAASSPAPDKPPKDKKPVVVYIMILFIAAFLLMALSFFMHQRSNTEALGELQNSFNAMQEIQISQEQIIELQEELETLREEYDAQQEAAAEAAAAQERSLEAMLSLYSLQQEYSAGNYESCQEIIAEMEEAGTPALLPDSAGDGITPPNRRYQELKAAVEEHLG